MKCGEIDQGASRSRHRDPVPSCQLRIGELHASVHPYAFATGAPACRHRHMNRPRPVVRTAADHQPSKVSCGRPTE
jgi:hypothetical protein